MDKKKQTIKKKTSDLKSGVFSFSEECYKNFSSIAFENTDHKGYALYLMIKIYSPTKNGEDFIYFSSSKLRDITTNYKPILEKLVSSNITQILKIGSFKYIKNKNYVGSCKLTNDDMELYIKTCEYIEFKLYDRAIKSNTVNFTLDINDTEIEQELWEYEECNLTDEEELTLIEKINRQKYLIKQVKSRNLKLSQYTNNRCYSNFSMLSSKFHKYFKIAGENVVEVDSHATFISFLPLICRSYIRNILNNNKEKYEKLLELEPENKMYKNIVDKNYELITGAEDCIIKFETKLKELFENKLSFYDYLQENISKKYDSCNFKKIVNSFIMSKKQYKVNKDIHDYFIFNYPEICKLINNMRIQNYYWREAEKIEVSIFTNSAQIIKKDGGNCLTKYDGILIQESLKNNLISLLYTNFKKHGIYSIFKVIEHKTQNTFKLSMNEAQEIHEEFYKESTNKIINSEQARIPTGSPSVFCLDKKDICIYTNKNETRAGEHIDTPNTLSRQNTRNRMINMKFMKDGRMSVYVKNKKYVSKKNDTLEDFKLYVFSKIDKEYKILIIWSERSEVVSEASEIKSLTTESKGTILVNDERTVDLSLEVDFSQDVVEMGDYTKTSQKAHEEARNDQCEESVEYIEVDDFLKLMENNNEEI